MIRAVRFSLNGKAMQLEREGDRTLLEVLLNDLGLTGTELGRRVGRTSGAIGERLPLVRRPRRASCRRRNTSSRPAA